MRGVQHKLVKDHHVFMTRLTYPSTNSTCTLITLDGPTETILLSEALHDSRWSNAIHAKLAALKKNGTWELVPLPPGKKLLSTKWVLKVKSYLDPSQTRMKARLVVKGYKQQEGINYNENFAPVVKWSTIWAIVALAVALNWFISHMDVVIAVLNGQLDEIIYMNQPPGFPHQGMKTLSADYDAHFMDLKKSLGMVPKNRLVSPLLGVATEFPRPKSLLLQSFYSSGSTLVIILLFMDDLLITSNTPTKIEATKQHLQLQYKMMKDLGAICIYLCVQFDLLPNGYFLHQEAYTNQLLVEAGMANCRPSSTQLLEGTVLLSDMASPSVDYTL